MTTRGEVNDDTDEDVLARYPNMTGETLFILRFALGKDDHLDLPHWYATAAGIVRENDPHRGPVRLTRSALGLPPYEKRYR